MTALRALLAGIIDYAGLFPPAALDMTAAVRNYASYRADDHAWMLGRFVLPASRLDEFVGAVAAVGATDQPEWRLSALLGNDAVADIERVRTFNHANVGRARIDSAEARLSTSDAIANVAGRCVDDSFSLFVEIPVDHEPTPLIESIKLAGIAAKIRTGGVTPDAFPSSTDVVRFIRRCIDAEVRFKATAGLHHPLHASYPLTYSATAPIAPMFGYLNVFLAAAFMSEGMADADAVRLLDTRNVGAFGVTSAAITWDGFRITAEQLRMVRGYLAVSFGSCAFREPVDELHQLAID